MSAGALAYAHVLKRVPSQPRSLRRVDAIVDAAATLLIDRDPGDLTIRDLATGAGVPTGTIYQFFEDGNAVLRALAVRYIATFRELLDSTLARRSASWAGTVDALVDAYAQLIRAHPAIRRLWLSGTLATGTTGLATRTDTEMSATIGKRLQHDAQSTKGRAPQWRALVVLIEAFLNQAFTVDEDGDPTTLREGKRAARAYAASILRVDRIR